MKTLKNSESAKVNESANEVKTSTINPLNISVMESTNFNLDIIFSGVEESEALSNRPALERVYELADNGYYLVMQPKTSRRNEAYLWIKATKQGEDREEFALYVNDEILKAVIAVLFGKTADISGIKADDLKDFNQRITNLEYALYLNEKAQGRTMKKTYTTTGQTFSSYYKKGVIIYKPYLNPELKAYLNA